MALSEPSTVRITYKGPYADLSTAPCCYSQTIRNIPVSKKPEYCSAKIDSIQTDSAKRTQNE